MPTPKKRLIARETANQYRALAVLACASILFLPGAADGQTQSLPTVSVFDARAVEGDAIEFTVSLSTPSSVPVTVQYATMSGTARSGTDFTAESGTLTFSQGDQLETVSVSTIETTNGSGGSLAEDDEFFYLILSDPTNATLGVPRATGAIRDDDSGMSQEGVWQIGIVPEAHHSAIEGDDIEFTVWITGGAAENLPAMVQYATSNLSAESGTDFTAVSGTLTFGANERVKTVRVSTIDDSLNEGNEQFRLTLSNPTNGSLHGRHDTAMGIIVNDDIPTVSVSDASAVEGEAVEFTLSLSGEAGPGQTSVHYEFEYGTADASDFTALRSGSILFRRGETSARVPARTTDDAIEEENETFSIRLHRPWSLRMGDSTATGTIIDNDGDAPTLSVSDAVATEGDTVEFTVSLSPASAQQVTVQYATSDGTAESATDFTAASGTLTFGANETSKPVSVATTEDSAHEEDETFTLMLSSPTNAALGSNVTATGTIKDDDEAEAELPEVSVSGGIATEGASVVFTVSLSAVSEQTMTVQYATSSGTATSGTDFTAKSGTIAMPPGSTSETLSVQTTEDTEDEQDETFTLTLSNPTHATLGTNTATGTINEPDEESLPLVSVSGGNSATEGSAVEFTVTLSKASNSTVTVNYTSHQASDDAATGGDDFSSFSGALILAPGATSGTIRVSTTDDAIQEQNETFTLSLTGATNADLSARQSAKGTIIDNDSPTVNVSDASATEGDAVAFTVSLSAASGQQVTVGYATSGGTATSGTDFTAASGTLTFGVNETSKTVSVATTDDSDDEENETFTLTLSSPTNATLGAATATGTINDDDDAAPLTASFSDVPASHDGNAFTFDLTFSEAFPISYLTIRDRAFTVTGGRVTRAKRVDNPHNESQGLEPNREWRITVEPGSATDTVTITLPATTDCATTGAICTEDGRRLSNSQTATVAGTVVVPTVNVSDASATEGDAVAFTVSLSAASGQQVTVGYATSGGTATSGTDFTAASGTLTFGVNETSKTVSVATTDDSDDEENETFTLTLSSPANATLGTTTATGTINDDDESLPTVSVFDAGAAEGGALAFTVSLSEASSQQVTVEYATSDGTAAAGSDYTAATGTLTFAANETSKTVSVATTDDSADEEDETFTLTLSGPANATLGDATATGTIVDDDEAPPVAVSVSDASATEGDAVEFAVSLSAANSGQVSVQYATSGGTATSGTDFTAESGTLTFAANETSKTVSVATTDDSTDEDNEIFTLRLSGPTNATLGDATATGTIVDDDDAVPLTAEFQNVPAAHDGSTAFTMRVSFSEDLVAGGSGRKLARALTLAGATRGTVRRVNERRDLYQFPVQPSGTDAVTVSLSATTDCAADNAVCTADGKALSQAVSVTVAGPAVTPALSVADASATEGSAVVFTVSLSPASSDQVTVAYATSGATATSGTDFTAASGTLTFAANETSKTVSVATTDDSAAEDDETFTLTLSNPANATLGDAAATGTINDDDDAVPPLTASFSDVPASHSGAEFTFELAFSEEFSLSYKTLRDEAFDVTGGTVRRARRQQQGSNLRWTITVRPASGSATVTITLPETTDCNASGAICTGDGRKLSHSLSATVTPAASASAGDAANGDADDDPLAIADGVTPDAAAAALFGERTLSEAQMAVLDRLGNRNGRYDLGDMLSWIERCRQGEARCGRASTDSGPASSAALLAAAAAGRRRPSKRPRRRDSGPRGRSPIRGMRRCARMARYGLAMLLVATIVSSCTGDSVGPTAAVPDPGFLTVEWTGPAASNDIGVLLELEGPGIETVRAPGLELYESKAPGQHQIVVAGSLRVGPFVQFRVPDRNQFALYRVRVLEVTGEGYGLRDPTEYRAVVVMN